MDRMPNNMPSAENKPFLRSPARVDVINVDGLARTKDDIVTASINDLFEAKTFEDMLKKAIEVRVNLERLKCFKSVTIEIDTSSGADATKEYGYSITYHVRELKRLMGQVNTKVGNNDVTLSVGVQSPNLFGRGECLQVEGKRLTNNTRNFNVSLLKPLLFANGLFSTSIYEQSSDHNASAFKLTEYGLNVEANYQYSNLIRHNISWEGVVRNLKLANRDLAPFGIRNQCGVTMKSAVKNNIFFDTRDSAIFPTMGGTAQLKTELAGLGGDVGFLKNEFYSQINATLPSNITLQGSFGTGIMNAIGKDKKWNIADNFFIGGPLNLRGFIFNTIGKKEEGYALGGSAYWLAAFHIYTPLPHRPKRGSFGDSFRLHFFSNVGNLDDAGSDLRETFRTLATNFRLACGFGFVFKLGEVARLEMNYCLPYIFQDGDQICDGVQFGLGMHFF